LTDVNMPKLSGLELLARARAAGLVTPFIFLTGYGDKEKAVKALRLGAMDFLEKPWDEDRLVAVVLDALEFGFAMRGLEAEVDDRLEQSGASGNTGLRWAARAILKMKRIKTIRSQTG